MNETYRFESFRNEKTPNKRIVQNMWYKSQNAF